MAERAQREMQKGGRARHLVEESGAHEAVRRPSQRVAVLHQTKRPVAIEKRDPLLRLQREAEVVVHVGVAARAKAGGREAEDERGGSQG